MNIYEWNAVYTALTVLFVATAVINLAAFLVRREAAYHARNQAKWEADPYKPGTICRVVGSDVRVVLINSDYGGGAWNWDCRVDNGPMAARRFTIARFIQEELTPIDAKK